jgi:hypothetical protein
MTEPENFITRWSRRKRAADEERAADQEKARAPAEERQSQEDAPPPASSGPPASRQVGEAQQAEAVPAFDLSRLPSLESITAETDIRAFLAPGVPADLTRAALRRAWTADPKIRDFVGLAEYAWDFDSPDGVPGFGPLEMTDDLRRFVDDMVGRSLRPEPPVQTETSPTREPMPSIESSTESGVVEEELVPQRKPDVALPQDERVPIADVCRQPQQSSAFAEEHIAVQHSSEKDRRPETSIPRQHGRALPQ